MTEKNAIADQNSTSPVAAPTPTPTPASQGLNAQQASQSNSARAAANATPPKAQGSVRSWARQRQDLWLGLGLALLSYISLRLSSPAVGFTRDEGYYFKAGEQYFGWYKLLWHNLWAGHFFATFSDATILRFFDYNHEHPVLIKTLMGFTWWWTHDVLGLTSNAEGFRVIGPLFAALTVAITFALARRMNIARPYAIFAGLAWLLMPHNYFYSHLACFDVPVTAMTVLVVYTYLAGRKTLKGALFAGLIFGLAVATKHNALFLAVLFVIHWAITQWRSFGFDHHPLRGFRVPPIPLVFFAMAVLGPVVMYLHWPYLWHHPLTRFGAYLAFHLNHENYPISFGQALLLKPPFPVRFPFVMTLYTMPVLTLTLALVGMGQALRVISRDLGFAGKNNQQGPNDVDSSPKIGSDKNSQDDDPAAAVLLLWGIMAIFPIALIALPNVPIFGGVKHWQPATPFLALFAAYALERLVWGLGLWFERSAFLARLRWALPAFLVALLLLPSLVDTASTHPYGMSYYNSLAGGVRGGAEKNLQRTFWGHSDRKLIIEALNRAPHGSRVFFNRTNYDSYRMYQRDKLLRKDIRYSSKIEGSDFALIFYQGGYYEELYKLWQDYGTRQALRTISLDGVPLVALYARPGKVLSPAP